MPGITVLLKALYCICIELIRKMLATRKDLCCLIQQTIILSRNSGINKCLTSVGRESRRALTTFLIINFLAVLSEKIDIKAYSFVFDGGVSKHP